MGISVSERNCKWDVFSQLYRTRARERACSAPTVAAEPSGWRARARADDDVRSSGARAWSSVWGWSSAGRGCVVSTPSPHAAGAQRLTQLRVVQYPVLKIYKEPGTEDDVPTARSAAAAPQAILCNWTRVSRALHRPSIDPTNLWPLPTILYITALIAELRTPSTTRYTPAPVLNINSKRIVHHYTWCTNNYHIDLITTTISQSEAQRCPRPIPDTIATWG
eukprot:COSAG02_NODE_20_length_53673_cov_86.864841_26_plen_221_part_00